MLGQRKLRAMERSSVLFPRNHEEWSSEETSRLMRLRSQNKSMRWHHFQKKFFPDRSDNALRARYSRLEFDKRKNATAEKRKHSASPSPPTTRATTRSTLMDCGMDSSENEWEDESSDASADPMSKPSKRRKRSDYELRYVEERSERTRKIHERGRSSLKKSRLTREPRRSQTAAKHSLSETASLDSNSESKNARGNDPDGKSDVQLAQQFLGPKIWALVSEQAQKHEADRKQIDKLTREKLALETELRKVKLQMKKMNDIQRLIGEYKAETQTSENQQ